MYVACVFVCDMLLVVVEKEFEIETITQATCKIIQLYSTCSCVHTFVMIALLVVGLSLLLVVASGHQCPLGFEPAQYCSSGNETRKCKCRKDLDPHIKCDEEKQQLYLRIGYCMSTYNDTDMTVVIGECPYIHPSARNSSKFPFFPFPPNMTASEVNGYMCGEMNRTGRLCGRCENGTGPSVFSLDLKCVRCLDSSYGWAVYLTSELIPITVFVLLVILFRIRLCADYMNALVFFCNIVSAGLLYSKPVNIFSSFPSNSESSAVSILISIYNIFNFRFFQNFFPPLCISEGMTNMEVLALRYLVALYPLLLVLVIYALVCLYDKNFKPLVLVWRPFGAIISCFRKQFNVRHSLIHAFASFFLLSFFSFSAVSYSFFHHNYLRHINSSIISTIFYWDGSGTHTNISVLTFTMLIVLAILPIVLMLVYPTRTFQKCLNCCGLRCLPLHIFMDAFQGCYKNGTDGTRDYRYFAGLYLLFRFLVVCDLLNYFSTHHLNPVFFLVIFSFSFALCRPYKNNCFNVVDCLFHAILALVVFVFSSDLLSASVPLRAFLLLLLCTPLFYLVILIGCFLFPKCKTFFSHH